MKRTVISIAAVLLTVCSYGQKSPENFLEKLENAGEFAPMFPFQPTHYSPDNITNVTTWKGVKKLPAGHSGFVSAKGDRFVGGDGKTLRFLGTNICFSGCFPTHADADKVSEELARWGINVVRLHYVHHSFPPGKMYPQTDSFIEPEQLERFDYLFSKLKEHGIYTYFQLNIARKFNETNGFENASRLPFYNNGVDNFDAHMIELQKRYHNEILNHRNKYTGLRYKEEPAISMLELSNENSIVFTWFSPKHRMPNLVEPYATDLKTMWNDFLRNKYGTDSALKDAWMAGLDGDGSQYIEDGLLPDENLGKLWGIQNDGVSEGSITLMKATPADKLSGKGFIRIRIDKNGATPNMPQFRRQGLKFTSMAPLCLKLKMRADRKCEVSVRFSQNHDPWQVSGLQSTVQVGKKWAEYEFNFTSNMDDYDVRLILSNFTPSVVDIADISLVSGMEYKWPKDQSLKAGNITWPGKNDWSLLPQRAFDFTDFLSSIELNYFRHLRSTLKNFIKPAQPIAGTQLHYGLDLPQAEMDYIDYHCYWNHPTFPGGSFDHKAWQLHKRALVNGSGLPGSNLCTASRSRILGKPFTISEFDHPNLNPYAAEGNIMAAAFGAFQNWSGILQFAWTHSTDFFRTAENTMFDMCGATQKLVHFPACHSMFVRGDVRQGNTDVMYVISATKDEEIKTIARNQNCVSPAWQRDNRMAALSLSLPSGRQIPEYPRLFNELGRKVIRTADDIPAELSAAYERKEVVNSSGELTWNWQIKDAGYFKVDTRNTKAFTGFVRGRSFSFRGMKLTPGKTRLDWLTLTLTNTTPAEDESMNSEKMAVGRYLLALTGLVHNSDAKIMEMGNGQLSASERYGGSNGHAPVMCEGIAAEITFAVSGGKVCAKALGEDGNPTIDIPVKYDGNGNATIKVGPEYRTVWYEVDIE